MSPCTPKALSPGVERQILGVKISARYPYVACTQEATRRGVQDTQRAGLEHVLIYSAMHTGRVAICAAQILRFRCV